MGKKGKTIQIVLDGSSSSESDSDNEEDNRVTPPFELGKFLSRHHVISFSHV